MRDLVLTLTVFSAIPVIFVRPWTGILVWSWLGYMNPHRLAWSYAHDFQFAMIIGVVTILAFLLKGEKRVPWNATLIAMLVYTLFTCATSLFALVPDAAYDKWLLFMKIQLMAFMTVPLINDRRRLDALIWVIVLSLGFYGLKGGIFSILGGGENRVWGPAGSFIGDNNALALALITTLPLMRYLQLSQGNRWIRYGLVSLMLLTVAAVLGTYSRGGFLALCGLGFYLMLKSRRRVMLGVATAVVVFGALSYMPQQWLDRMDTIVQIVDSDAQTIEEAGRSVDSSLAGRFDAWQFAVNLANNRPLTGGGFGVFGHPRPFAIYNPDAAGGARAAHSVYFEVIGEHGWLGFLLFMTVLALAWLQLNTVNRRSRGRADLIWLRDLSAMLKVSLFVYGIAGATLNLATFDLFWHLIVISVICHGFAIKAASAVGSELPVAAGVDGRRAAADPTEPDSAADPASGLRTGGASGYLIERR